MSLVTTEWLEKNISKVKVIDSSWHMPNVDRDGYKEYIKEHIQNAIFFDIDKNSDKDSNLPHMLCKKNEWEKILSNLGIGNTDHIVIYDHSDVISSCRIWYNLIYFGHSPELVSVLDGGFKKWVQENRKVTQKIKEFGKKEYTAKENLSLVLNKNQIETNIQSKIFELVDARSKDRFLGTIPETRKNLLSGNIKGSKNLPYTELINSDRTFKKKDELEIIFKKNKVDLSKTLAFTCGSGITACVLGLTNSIISGKKPIIYDGSWAEYGIK